MKQTTSLLLALGLLGFAACADPAPPEPQNTLQEPSEETLQAKEDAARELQEGKADGTRDLCSFYNWYGDGECDQFCAQPDPDCELTSTPVPSGNATNYPIILAHGFNASTSNSWSFWNVAETLKADGHTVVQTQVPPFHSAEVRASYLSEQIDQALQQTGASKVNIIAHSMGGLDSRIVISAMGYEDRVASLTTISTPHRGSGIADAVLSATPRIADEAINYLGEIWGLTYNELAENTDVRAALTSISEKHAVDFNASYPDVQGAYYQSWAGVASAFGTRHSKAKEACQDTILGPENASFDKVDLRLYPMLPFVTHGLHRYPSDGMVRVDSATWGKFRGCIRADHYNEVGQPQLEGPHKHTGFDHQTFYRDVAFELAELGF